MEYRWMMTRAKTAGATTVEDVQRAVRIAKDTATASRGLLGAPEIAIGDEVRIDVWAHGVSSVWLRRCLPVREA